MREMFTLREMERTFQHKNKIHMILWLLKLQ